eukprot:scaffold111784_cov65-Phaeocystis_antarctica.AAC.1
MQGDGNLVYYDANGARKWAFNSAWGAPTSGCPDSTSCFLEFALPSACTNYGAGKTCTGVKMCSPPSPPYAQASLGDADCPTDYAHITSSADCEAAATALGLCDSSKWTGRTTGIPVGCSHRPNHCGRHDWHWNTATTGRGRSDLRPICRLMSRIRPSPAAYPGDLNAWYCSGAFDIASSTWQDCSGNGMTATLSGSGLAESRSAGHGTASEVLALSGTTSSVIAFGAVIQSEFTVCSVTRYTGGTKGRILNGGGANWLHGHWGGRAGVAHYGGWKTAAQDYISPDTDWLVMCGTNAGSQLKLVNGVDVGTGTGGTGGVSLFVNAGVYGNEKSDFAIAE